MLSILSHLCLFWESFSCLRPFFTLGYIHNDLWNKISHFHVWIQSVLDISHVRLALASSCVAVTSFLHPSQLCWHWFLCSMMLVGSESRKQWLWVSCERLCVAVWYKHNSELKHRPFWTGEGGCVQVKIVGCFFCIAGKEGGLQEQLFFLDHC